LGIGSLFSGAWLSWLERRVHIAEIAGSIPAAPIYNLLCQHDKQGAKLTPGPSSMSIIRAIFCMLTFLQFTIVAIPQQKLISIDSGCIAFEAPLSGALIKSTTCTLSISACPNVESIHLSACFFSGNGITDTVLDLGTISQPPFKLIWNITDMPNQLFKGMWFLADAAYKHGMHQTIRQDGVFLYSRQVSSVDILLPISSDQQKLFFIDTLPSIRTPMVLNVLGNWNAQGLHFTVLVMDPSFSMTLPKEKIAELGAIICLDPLSKKSPYPSETSLIMSFPLLNKPCKLLYKKKDGPKGSLNFFVDTIGFPFPATIKTAEGKGYGLDITIPKEIFASEMPESLLCNILIKVLDRNGQISAISINRVSGNEALCPLLWVTMHRQQNDFFSNAFYVFLVCFGGGLIIAFLTGYFLLLRGKKTVTFNKIDLSEEEKQLAKTVYGYLEQNITSKSITITETSRELSLSSAKIESIIKKYNGLSFKKYIVQARIEIAKERLRSSHASESSIAESCGFKNMVEMEKSFAKYCRTTPFRYRRDNQVA
jgi:AraC-like DNA-binding protein